MVARNLKPFVTGAKERNINMQYILSGSKQGDNGNAVIIDGYKFDRVSQYLKEDVTNFLDYVQKYGAKSAYEARMGLSNSVAKQKVNDAWGRTMSESAKHHNDQQFTYADGIKHLIQFKGQKLSDCLDALVDLTETSKSLFNGENMNDVRVWTRHMGAWHNPKILKCQELIKNKEVYVINGFIYTNYNLFQFIKLYAKSNNYMITDEQIQAKVNAWVSFKQKECMEV